MQDSTGTDQDMNDQNLTMNAADAAAIMAEASDRARRRLEPNHRVLLLVFGPVWFLGDGIEWLGARGQHPYHGPDAGAYAAAFLIATAAAMITVGQARADTGLRGRSMLGMRLFFGAALAGFGAVFALEGALVHAGASHSVVGIFEASAPILVLGLLYLTRFSVERNWVVTGLGLWLVVVAAVAGYAGPVAVWGIDALAVGLAFLLAAAVAAGQSRARRA
jgi:hypothetical protein